MFPHHPLLLPLAGVQCVSVCVERRSLRVQRRTVRWLSGPVFTVGGLKCERRSGSSAGNSAAFSTSEAGLRSERPGWLLRGAAGDVRTQWETVRDSNSVSPPGLVCKDTGAGAGTQRGVRTSSDRAGRLRHREELSCEPRGSRGGRACMS